MQLYKRETRNPLPVVCARLEKALAEHRYAILSVTDLKPRLLSKGVLLSYGSRLYEVCQASATRALLDQCRAMAVILPWRIVVHDDVRGTVLCTALPTRVWAALGANDYLSAAQTLEADLQAILNAASE